MTESNLIDSMLADPAPEKSNGTPPPVVEPKEYPTLGSTIAPDIKTRRFSYGGTRAGIVGKAAPWQQAVDDLRRVHDEDGERKDVAGFTYARSRVRLDDEGRLILRNGVGPFRMRKYAAAQLCTHIKAPLPYLATLPANLACQAINHGLKTKGSDRPRVVRCTGDTARAIVSDRYEIFDDVDWTEFLGHAFEASGMLDSVQVEELKVGKRTNLRVSFGKVRNLENADGHGAAGDSGFGGTTGSMKTTEGFGVRAVLNISNGELGNASFKGSAGLFVPWCTNGCTITLGGQLSFSCRHSGKLDHADVGKLIREIVEQLAPLTDLPRKAAEAAFDLDELQARIDALNVTKPERRKILREAFAEGFGLYANPIAPNLDAMRRAADIEQAIHEARKEHDDERIAAEVMEVLRSSGREAFNAWDLSQGITAVARDTDSDRGAKLEEIGGEILAAYMTA